MITIVRKIPVDEIIHRKRHEVFPVTFFRGERVPMFGNGTLIKCYFENLPEMQMRFRIVGKRAGHIQWDFISVSEFHNLKFMQMDASEIEILILELMSDLDIEKISGVFLWQIWALGGRI